MLQAGAGSGGGVSPAGGGGGGDVARSLAGQVKALRSRVEELLERARDAEVGDFLTLLPCIVCCLCDVFWYAESIVLELSWHTSTERDFGHAALKGPLIAVGSEKKASFPTAVGCGGMGVLVFALLLRLIHAAYGG